MQHIPHHSLEDLERSRADMEAFRENLKKEKHIWPDLTLTGEDIHRAFCVVTPDQTHWAEVPSEAKQLYNNVAIELNRDLDARQAWFESEDTISDMKGDTN